MATPERSLELSLKGRLAENRRSFTLKFMLLAWRKAAGMQQFSYSWIRQKAEIIMSEETSFEEAYSFFSWRLRQKNSFEEFKNFVERNPQLKKATGFVIQSSRTDSGVVTLEGVIETNDDRVIPVRYKVVTENGFWKIRYINTGQITFE